MTDNKISGVAAGTLVHTDTGLVPIEQLTVGDKVLSKAADGSGELVYKAITNTMVTENTIVKLLELSVAVDNSLPIQERLRLQRIVNNQRSTNLLVTDNHPFWVKEKGWLSADKIVRSDNFLDKENTSYIGQFGNNPYSDSLLGYVYQTEDPHVGYMPDMDEDNPAQYGSLIDLRTAEVIAHDVTRQSILDKLYEYDPEWKERLLAQTPEDQREGAEFFGFRQGEWLDPDTVDWKTGEGLVRTTVYNIEVEDTHSYFVGEAGIWVQSGSGRTDDTDGSEVNR